MTLVKRNNGLFDLPSIFDDFITRSWFDGSNDQLANNGGTVPAVNVKENENHFTVEMAAPGLGKDDFKIELNDDVLTISSEKENKVEEKDENGRYTRREFSYSSFRRSFTLPEIADDEKIEAKYENGVLNLIIPKKEEVKPKVKQITIG